MFVCYYPILPMCFNQWTFSVNKPAKYFLKQIHVFQEWYSNQVMEQMKGQDIETTKIQTIDLSMTVLKEAGSKWLVKMEEYFVENPQIIVNGIFSQGLQKLWMGTKTIQVKQMRRVKS